MHRSRMWETISLAWFALSLLSCTVTLTEGVALAQAQSDVPRIDSLVILDPQPHRSDPAVIWFDDFDSASQQDQYAEKSGELVADQRFGDSGMSLQMDYPKGSQGIGGRKVFFGDSPTNRRQVVRGSESFDDVYWRIYVKHPHDWTGGGPAKLSRATSLVPPGWRQAMIAHVWSSGEALTLDPASGVRDDRVVTTRYNDFDRLRWLGNRPASRFKLHGEEGSGWWVCVEARAKLNTPGKADGVNQLWIDGRLEAERLNLDWRGRFEDYGINAVFLEAYWNEGSPVDQARWIDNFVISTKPIGPIFAPRNPILIKTPSKSPQRMTVWQVELAADENGQQVVWQSNRITDGDRIQVGAGTGTFSGRLQDRDSLEANATYYCRVRQRHDEEAWSPWSAWHQPFQTH